LAWLLFLFGMGVLYSLDREWVFRFNVKNGRPTTFDTFQLVIGVDTRLTCGFTCPFAVDMQMFKHGTAADVDSTTKGWRDVQINNLAGYVSLYCSSTS
jgi:hypothetical protein